MAKSYLNVSMQPTGMNLGKISRGSVKRKYDFVLHQLSLSVEFKSCIMHFDLSCILTFCNQGMKQLVYELISRWSRILKKLKHFLKYPE